MSDVKPNRTAVSVLLKKIAELKKENQYLKSQIAELRSEIITLKAQRNEVFRNPSLPSF